MPRTPKTQPEAGDHVPACILSDNAKRALGQLIDFGLERVFQFLDSRQSAQPVPAEQPQTQPPVEPTPP